ncbi:MAG: putative selenium-dependent hydroxylase accessory protein YqeC [Chloroflexi bacterium]|nr:putative selenium-dependent hydroxylase accessory protein YqeC [Chloroflexota bacterium]
MRLQDALRVQRGDVVAFIGAGGKTSALFRLAKELSAGGWRVLVTTTTRLARHELEYAPLAVRLSPEIAPAQLHDWLDRYPFVFLYGDEDTKKQKVIGLSPDSIAGLIDAADSDVLLIEADGARRLPLKAPYDHEPVIPADATVVVPVAGVDVLGQPLDEAHVYNAARIQARYGFPDGAQILPPWLAVTIRDLELGLRGIPESARVVSLLNKVPPRGYERLRARRVAQMVLRSPRVEAVALGSVQNAANPVYELQQRTSAVVLAAGLSTRMGQPKVLLPWDRRTVIETIVGRLLAARVSDIVVVTGHHADAVERVLRNLPVRVVHNPDYARGEMISSVQAGLRALPNTSAACLVVLGDQPALDPRIVGQLHNVYAEGRGNIVAPVYRGERGHPVLFDRRFWPELLALKPGSAPRDVVRQHTDQLVLVDVANDSILRDIDTPEAYRWERRRAGLR